MSYIKLADRKKAAGDEFKFRFREVKNTSKREMLCDQICWIVNQAGLEVRTDEWRVLCGLKPERD